MKSHAQSARMIIIIRRPTRGRIEFYFVDVFALLSFWYAGFVCLPLFFPLRFLLLDDRAKSIGSLTQTDWRLYRPIVKTVENKVKFTVRVDCNCFVFVTYNGSNRNHFMHDKYVTFFVILLRSPNVDVYYFYYRLKYSIMCMLRTYVYEFTQETSSCSLMYLIT